jgi:hypothetical protein
MNIRVNRLWIITLLLIVGPFLTISMLHAEGNCPPGYSPIGATGGQAGPQGCAPTPGYNQALATHWEDRWGAIFTDAEKGILGAVSNMPSEDQARQAAMADCQTKGGTQCKFQFDYKNKCAAMVLGDKVFNVSGGDTAADAIQSGIKRCSVQSANCHAYYSACSPAAKVQN